MNSSFIHTKNLKTKKAGLYWLVIVGIVIIISSCQKSIEQLLITPGEPGSVTFSNNPSFSPVQERPFKGRITGSFVNSPTSNPAIYHGVANATGNVTQLGVFSKVTSDVIDILSSAVEGTFAMTSTGGEQITGKYNGTYAFGTIPGTFSWVLNATVTGGTGRFSHATGEFVFLATGNYVMENGIVSGDYTETFDGIIVF